MSGRWFRIWRRRRTGGSSAGRAGPSIGNGEAAVDKREDVIGGMMGKSEERRAWDCRIFQGSVWPVVV